MKPPTPEEMAKEAITWHPNRANFGVAMQRGFAEGVQAERDRAAKDKPVVVLPREHEVMLNRAMYDKEDMKRALDIAGVAWEEQP